MDELCYRLSVSIRSQFEDRIVGKGDYEEQQVEQKLINQVVDRLENRQEQAQRMENAQQVQSQQIAELMRQNKMLRDLLVQISGKIQKDYFLALTDDDVKRQESTSALRVKIEPEKGQDADYHAGEKIRFRVQTSRGCYIKVIYVTSLGESRHGEKRMNIMFFPNEHERDNWLPAGENKIIGKHGELEIQPPFGKDVVTVVASEKQFTDIETNLKQASGTYYSVVTGNSRDTIRVRGLGVFQPATSEHTGSLRPSDSGTVASDTCFIVSHPK